ncbi:763_t:CDS:2 [Gigaspora rosea]|nr:763_t:CDS:2 [Gigaspora rosea]
MTNLPTEEILSEILQKQSQNRSGNLVRWMGWMDLQSGFEYLQVRSKGSKVGAQAHASFRGCIRFIGDSLF